MSGGWGLGGWGTSLYGTSVAPALEYAFATGDRGVRVHLSAPPQARGAAYAGDALNPATWRVTRDDTGADLVVASVSKYDTQTFDLVVLFPLGNADVSHTVVTVGLRDAAGVRVPTSSAAFDGCTLAPLVAPPVGTVGDLRNAPAPAPTGSVVDSVGGTLEVSSDGDLRLDGTEATVRKLILRRLTTPLGGFAHLPEYGFNLPVKGVIPPIQIPALRADIAAQVKREREVLEAAVQVQQAATGVLTISVQARLRTGTAVSVSTRVIPSAA
jgi:hypothetical protein